VPQQQWGVTWDELPMYTVLDRTHIRTWFHYSDVPEAVIAAEESRATVIPRSMALQSIIPGVTAPYAARISCPVFLAFGEVDVSPDPLGEPSTYPDATDVTVLRLPGSGHCHNYSTPRAHLWERLASWVPAVA
jgi:pimeloyl-ACP methyl ester carboxylesterase